MWDRYECADQADFQVHLKGHKMNLHKKKPSSKDQQMFKPVILPKQIINHNEGDE